MAMALILVFEYIVKYEIDVGFWVWTFFVEMGDIWNRLTVN